MTETNDLLKRIERGLNEMPTKAMQDIKAYGKAEFERGRAEIDTCAAYIKGVYDCEREIVNNPEGAYQKTFSENEELKDQNKELMRENAKLRGLVNDQSLTLVRMKDIKDENNYLMDKITDYEKGPKQYLKDILNNISLSGVSDEILKGFNECKDLIDIMMYDVNNDEDLARKAQKPEWYDAEKCLPLLNATVIIEYKSDNNSNTDPVVAKFKYDADYGTGFVFVHNRNGHVLHSYPGVISRWRYADE